MTTRSWVLNLFARRTRTARKAPARYRPALEGLEDRLAPATLTVNSTADTASAADAYLSLRQAIAIVNSATLPSGLSPQILAQISGTLHEGGADTIVFDPAKVTGPITLGGTQLRLSLPGTTAAITIDGGTAGVTVDGDLKSRILQVDGGVHATLARLTLTRGSNDERGGGIANSGTLTVSRCTLSGNNSPTAGGGIVNINFGTLTVRDSTLTKNSGGTGGAICNGGDFTGGLVTLINSNLSENSGTFGGAIANDGTVRVINSTLWGNTAQFAGGGISNVGTMTVINSTLSGNSSVADGGGIVTGDSLFGDRESELTLNNTIVAGNLRGGGSDKVPDDVRGMASDSSSSNLIGVGSGSNLSNAVNGNQVGTPESPIDPKLGPLQDNGGPTQTLALKPGSPAIDKGNTTLAVDQDGRPLAADQRGYDRLSPSGGTVDIGAFEVQQPALGPSTLPDGTYAASYSQALTAAGTVDVAGPFTFAVTAGSLPPGLTLAGDGTLSGTPTAAGAFTFTATATAAGGHTGSREYTLTIGKVKLTVRPDAGQSKTYGAAVPGLSFTVDGDPDLTLSGALGTEATAASPVGAYAFTAGTLSAGDLYEVVLAADAPTFAVTRAKLIVTAGDATKIAGEANPPFTVRYEGFVLGEGPGVLGGTLTFSTPATAGSPPGTYGVTPGGLTSGNYEIEFVSGTLTVLSPSEATSQLNERVAASGLDKGTRNSLNSKLQAAAASFNAGKAKTGANQLAAFINHVSAQRGKKIDAALADALIADARRIINAVG
jgi:hypothetical protein